MTGVAGNSRLGTVTLMIKRWRDNCAFDKAFNVNGTVSKLELCLNPK